jgi:arylsulfatase A-like enzyme
MLVEMDHTQQTLRREYQQMVDKSVERFWERVDLIRERGIADDTLIIFMSDHGELLGERGLVSHSSPSCPELVYVPTVFIHPNIGTGRRDETIGHVDLVPTVTSILKSVSAWQDQDGVDLSQTTAGARYNDAMHSKPILNQERVLYHDAGLWDGDGGDVFKKRGRLLSPGILSIKARGWNRVYLKRNPTQIGDAVTSMVSPQRFGNPSFSRSGASKRVSEVIDSSGDAERVEIDEEVKQRLEELGYR